MSYAYDIAGHVDIGSLGVISEILLVTICLSTIIFLWTKNQYISYFSAAPIFYFVSLISFGNTHLIFLVLAMTIQAVVNIILQKQMMRKEAPSKHQTHNL
jgi:hypothetical protein